MIKTEHDFNLEKQMLIHRGKSKVNEQLRAMEHGYRIHVGITDQATIGIDTPEDIAEFEACLP